MLEHVSRAAKLSKPVLVIGERGTGKELIASRLHYLSPRWGQPLIKVNCAALTETLLETELFGHQAGAFTGATRTHIGRFEQANGGTLVLDELGTIPPRMQEKILRVIEYGEFQRVGGSDTISHRRAHRRRDERASAAARRARPVSRRLARPPRVRRDPRAAAAGAPRGHQHARVSLRRERHEASCKRPFFPGFTADAKAALLGYALARQRARAQERDRAQRLSHRRRPSKPINEILFDPFASPYSPAPPPEPRRRASRGRLPRRRADRPRACRATFVPPWHDFERQVLRRALERAQFKQTVAAKLLGLSYHQLRSLLRKHGLAKQARGQRRLTRPVRARRQRLSAARAAW